jgi:hypothetical protein
MLIVLAAFPAAVFGDDEGPARGVPELEALSNYIGMWDIAVTSRQSPFVKGQTTAKWILDGRFVEQTGYLTTSEGTNRLKVTTLMTYDSTKKAYRMWSFMSNGRTSEAEAKWDPAARTMTSVHRNGPMTTTTTANFAQDGVEKWKIIVTDQTKMVIQDMSGTNTRRAKP